MLESYHSIERRNSVQIDAIKLINSQIVKPTKYNDSSFRNSSTLLADKYMLKSGNPTTLSDLDEELYSCAEKSPAPEDKGLN